MINTLIISERAKPERKKNMQANEIYLGRRCNKRMRDQRSDFIFGLSLPDQNRRLGDRRCNTRRRNERLNFSFDVSLPDHDAKTINVSASGFFLEVITNNIKAFSPGTAIPIKMFSVIATSGFNEKKLKLDDIGTVIRNRIIPSHENKLGVAMELMRDFSTV